MQIIVVFHSNGLIGVLPTHTCYNMQNNTHNGCVIFPDIKVICDVF